jgi:Fibronectin type III domain
MSKISRVIVGLAVLALFAVPAHAGSVTLSWDANSEPNVVGYTVYYGTQPGVYAFGKAVGNVTTWTVDNLPGGQTYYFALKAVSSDGLTSPLSEEVSTTLPADAPAGPAGGTASAPSNQPGGTASTPASPAGGTTAAPFGQVDSPQQGAAGIVGAIPVTGWALDDGGVSAVKIYRNCLPFEPQTECQVIGGANVVYVGDAAFVEGARPDVEAAFPTYPQAHRAGWGYLLLTNMLPDVPAGLGYGGRGTLQLYAFASDAAGQLTLLGRTTADHTPTAITMANDSIASPFGAIDTPYEGQTIGGTFANFGWAVTPDQDAATGTGDILIPVNGSTMVVYVDGVAMGTVGYNQCRGTVGNPVPAGLYCDDDVANIFGNPTPRASLTPRTANATRYRNLDAARGAIGTFMLDTRQFANGLHTLSWGVTDSAGRAAGIGSRYFTVLNSMADLSDATVASQLPALFGQSAARPDGSAAASPAPVAAADAGTLASLKASQAPVSGRTGFDQSTPVDTVPADVAGVRHVQLAELGRLELWLGTVDAGYLVANGTLRGLPTGSTLDAATGHFSWMPGPGFVGAYRLAFVRGSEQIAVDVTIRPVAKPAAGESEIRMNVDLPVAGQTIAGAITVAGWALDPQADIGSGIDAVHVWAQRRDAPAAPEFVGSATLDGARPDVAQAFGVQFGAAGFGLVTTPLTPGQYDLTVFAWNRRTARWEDARTVTVTVR